METGTFETAEVNTWATTGQFTLLDVQRSHAESPLGVNRVPSAGLPNVSLDDVSMIRERRIEPLS